MKCNNYSKNEIDLIRSILLNYWDPVGVGNNSNLRDEYDDFIPSILQYLENKSRSQNDIFEYLLQLETDTMGKPEDPQRINIAAEMLFSSYGAMCDNP
jgi:hypothetical protein